MVLRFSDGDGVVDSATGYWLVLDPQYIHGLQRMGTKI